MTKPETQPHFFKEMLNRYHVGDTVFPQDAADLAALLERHDERDEKFGTGIVGFEFNSPPDDVPQFSQLCFWAVRMDGTKIDFSIAHCLKPQPYD
ncbi:MAG: DCL family protein [Burkholderiaceae bacterium]|nr:DCL family protein [Burkholderiaceae bacterium]